MFTMKTQNTGKSNSSFNPEADVAVINGDVSLAAAITAD
jgi:hypothetical protein